jgi:uncharacterized SAM-binding protein YcdF (DUF218 family)
MKQERIDVLARKIWNYLRLNQKPSLSDCIVIFGSHDLRVAKYGADLFLKKLAPLMVVSGKRGHLTERWRRTEAEKFAQVAIQAGVPRNKILMEKQATNSGENVLFTKRLLAKNGINPRRIIVVHKPYMERRAWATFRKVWPQKKIVVTSPPLSFDNYPNRLISKTEMIAIMLSDFQKIKLYAKQGFQIRQRIPKAVMESYQQLVRLGYAKHLKKMDSKIIQI